MLKKYDSREQKAFVKLMKDVLRSYVPEYRGDVLKNNDSILLFNALDTQMKMVYNYCLIGKHIKIIVLR